MRMDHGDFADASRSALTPGAVRDWTGDETFGSQRVPEGWKQSWNAPICERCWVDQRGAVQPVRALPGPDEDQWTHGARCCAFCGRPTWAGIFVRENPLDVPYPELEPVGRPGGPALPIGPGGR